MEQLKAIFISYNQAYHEFVVKQLERLNIKGYTAWEQVTGRGSRGGEPHLGEHAWPILNSAMLVIIQSELATRLLEQLKLMDEKTPEQGLRAFTWSITDSI